MTKPEQIKRAIDHAINKQMEGQKAIVALSRHDWEDLAFTELSDLFTYASKAGIEIVLVPETPRLIPKIDLIN